MPDALVIDASALLDAAAPGPRFDTMSQLHERFALRAPELLAYEVGSVVHGRRAREHGTTPVARAGAVELLLAGIELIPTDAAMRARCGALAAAHALTFYDASYLELAETTDAALVTQDQALLAAGRRILGDERAVDLADAPRLLARAPW